MVKNDLTTEKVHDGEKIKCLDTKKFYSDEKHNKNAIQEAGEVTMYSPITGDRIKSTFCMGIVYYMRLKQMVKDKIQSRETGVKDVKTQQPPQGKARGGGLKIGEMERDCVISHGIGQFVKESYFERSDPYTINVNEKSGLIDWNEGARVTCPYSMKQLIQEVGASSIGARVLSA